MATKQQKDERINSLRSQFASILALNVDNDLIRKDDLGKELNFEPLRSSFENVIQLVNKLNLVELQNCSLSQLQKLGEDFGQVHSRMVTLKQFNVTNMGNPTGERNSLIVRFEQAVDKFIDAAVPVLLMGLVYRAEDESQLKLLELAHRIQNEGELAIKESKTKVEEINTILENAKSAAVKTGVAAHGNIFGAESVEHAAEAKKWLNFTVWMLIGTGAIAIIMFLLMFCPAVQNAKINPIQLAISKIVILTICFIGVNICNKNYKAHKHNAILNKHRQNALSTFETFVKAGSDDQTKNAVLLQTTQSIFASQNTGYNSAENDNEVPNKIIEIVKSSGKTQA